MIGAPRYGRFLAITVGIAGISAALVSCGGGGSGGGSSTGQITTKAQLGQALFFDTTMSNPTGMACATCHSPNKGFSDPRGGPTSAGVVPGLFGFRHAPSINYMAYSPTFQLGSGESGGGGIGGQFWDGRAPDLPTQAKSPLTNPIEMNNTSAATVVAKVAAGPEAAGMKLIYGANWNSDPNAGLNDIVDAIATFERTPAISPFTSKFDAYLKGTVQLSASELDGLAVFNGKGGCASCHDSSPTLNGTPPLFTNFCYANIGLPKNPNNPYYKIPALYNPLGANFIDHGLMNNTGRSLDDGNFMTPTLRNVATRGPYFHNGIYTTLAQVINFYNTRDVGNFPPPEVPATEDLTELGNLQLTAQEQSDLIAFLNTLTDGYPQ